MNLSKEEIARQLSTHPKYSGADYELDGSSACSRSPNKAMNALIEDKQENAAKAILFEKMIVELLEALDWYIETDETNIGQEGNESYEAGLFGAIEKVERIKTKLGIEFTPDDRNPHENEERWKLNLWR